jgi:hypothetical protein
MDFSSFAHVVVFDGTSAYVIPSFDLDYEIGQNEVEPVKGFNDFNKACEFEETYNAEATNNGRY